MRSVKLTPVDGMQQLVLLAAPVCPRKMSAVRKAN